MKELLPLFRRTATIVGRALLLCVACVGSLLTFPNAIPWMIAVWLAAYSVARLAGRGGWLPVALLAAILSVKCVPFSLTLASLGGAIVLAWVAGRLAVQGGAAPPRWVRVVGLAIVWSAYAATAYDWYAGARLHRRPTLRPDRPVVCLGNSLTSDGANRGGYPDRLARRLAVPVVNCGRPGISATEAARRDLHTVLAAEPQAVVVELGGHEFNQDRPRREAYAALEQIIRECRQSGAEVILMEVPRGYVTDGYRYIERELARKYGLELIPDTCFRWIILHSREIPPGSWGYGEYLADDAIHPNAAGQAYLAECVADALARVYGPEIRKD